MAERKKIKLKKTRGGAQQYERSKGDFKRQVDDLFYKFMANPSGDPDFSEKRVRLKAGMYGASEYLDDSGELEELLMGFAKEDAKERRSRPVNKKEGGAAFPDLTGDGKVTKKDILRGRGVKGFKNGGKVRGYGKGGGVCRGGGAAISGTKFSGVK